MEAVIETPSLIIEAPDLNTLPTKRATGLAVRLSDDEPATGQPRPEWVRGICPQCGDQLISNCYYVGGRGYLVVWECWNALGEYARDVPDEERTCRYRKVL